MSKQVWIHRSFAQCDYYYASEDEAIKKAQEAAGACGCSMRHICVYKLVAIVNGEVEENRHPVQTTLFD